MKIVLKIENKTKEPIPTEKDIIGAICDVLKEKNVDIDAEVGLKIVGEKEIQKLNKKYRNLDKPTDVLSFPIYDIPPKKSDSTVLLGDIVICPKCAKYDFLFLAQHAVLHLLGVHHK